MSICKIFVIGPHDAALYHQLRSIVAEEFEHAIGGDRAPFSSVEIKTPDENPTSDQFQDWILGQIDTASFVIADVTGFNANVMYEIAFAHAIGTPVVYFSLLPLDQSAIPPRILHYLQFSLINIVPDEDFRRLEGGQLSARLASIFRDGLMPSENLLSSYYGGVPPIDAEFTRGLAHTYYRNFLGPLLTYKGDVSHLPRRFCLIIPDTLEVSMGDIGQIFAERIGGSITDEEIASNALDRKLKLKCSKQGDFVYDIPSALFTLKDSRRYRNIANSKNFTEADRDRVTDAMMLKFVDEILRMRDENEALLGPLDRGFEPCWMSELTKEWADPTLMSNRRLPKPRRPGR